ncbi:hypothetical protein M9458_019239, partial [Cirrhinus mrigala]
ASHGAMCLIASDCFCTAGQAFDSVAEQPNLRDGRVEKGLFVDILHLTKFSQRWLSWTKVSADGSLHKAEKPERVAAEGATLPAKERRDRSDIILMSPQQAHESSTPDTEDNERVRPRKTGNNHNQEDMDGTAGLPGNSPNVNTT